MHTTSDLMLAPTPVASTFQRKIKLNNVTCEIQVYALKFLGQAKLCYIHMEKVRCNRDTKQLSLRWQYL